ncbi:pyridoxal phosphate-dependent decarboxylase family protein [Oceanibacterium hippocampi]|uniref:pyridoxal phosphate-dependent decarboxylase family protein n=1 Tax=Oceanibacterium hippocampi TaxID=745714 RepID=UPI000A266D16|nr:pyridoxal-dependent decarboxylase [Oceanibacterium hippocampi]
MDNEAFRAHAHQLVDWMADYLETIEERPVRSRVAPGEIAGALPPAAPGKPEDFAAIFRDFEQQIVPGLTHWQHPSFFAYFPANSSPPSVLAEMLTATVAQVAMIWQTSPAATELEQVVLDWLRQMIGLPDGFTGVIQDTASTATLAAMIAARERASDSLVNDLGFRAAPRLTVYCSAEAHSSVEKDVRIAGFGRSNLRLIDSDDAFAMRPDLLASAIEADIAAGARPAIVVATLGTTAAGGFDSLRAVGELCARHGIWLHVDAAWAGSALILPEQRWMLDGIEFVDSFVFNPHKWLLTNFDCTALYVRDTDQFVDCFAIDAAYLRTREGDRVTNYRDWGIQLGRRFRALKLWFVLRSYGLEGLQAIIRRHVALAGKIAGEIAREPGFEILAPARLALFVFRLHPPGLDDEARLDRLNEQLLEALNDSGQAYFTQARAKGRYGIRFSVGQTATEDRHVEEAWALIRETAGPLIAEAEAA